MSVLQISETLESALAGIDTLFLISGSELLPRNLLHIDLSSRPDTIGQDGFYTDLFFFVPARNAV